MTPGPANTTPVRGVMTGAQHLSAAALASMCTTIFLMCSVVASWADTRWMDVVAAAFVVGCAVSNGVVGFQVWMAQRTFRAEASETGAGGRAEQ